MFIEDFVEAAEMWNSLGWSVQVQIKSLLSGDWDIDDINENAIPEIAQFADTLYSVYNIDVNNLHSAIDLYENSGFPEEEFEHGELVSY